MKDSSISLFDTISTIGGNLSTESELNLHRGKVVEYIARRHPMGLSAICRKLGISRRTLYNWFEKEALPHYVIAQLGSVIDHDFTVEFPGEACKVKRPDNDHAIGDICDIEEEAQVHFWMNKYIDLLEKFNQSLLLKHESNTQKESSDT
ncbi:helix-turn-helix domain-containing protein [Mucilaginibacter aquariorum]|uniref:Helix-turn-helix domain-containing protein n=1 Tax=Mucilaginibacter aquariorum TaxID=2967225 RepID=A0ABT1T3N6_9SPHI|nr:helix-turn-helix domain-containing protein [Mucilaginibacter aquariorum]MCQ6959214.1 helix-turn-helix domain-containing protein [Mucilaginibacter aquariorum]